jgi:hypothetical protein
VSDPAALEVELRRLRAALGVSAEELAAAPESDPVRRLAEELRFLQALVAARSDDPGAAREELLGLWRELRLRATALAADLPPTADSVRLLRERLARDQAESGPPGDRSGTRR